MYHSFYIPEKQINLFGKHSEVVLNLNSDYVKMSGMVISKDQLTHAQAHAGEYADHLKSTGINDDVIERHLATILNPPRVFVGFAPGKTRNPGGMVQIGSTAQVPHSVVKLRRKGEALEAFHGPNNLKAWLEANTLAQVGQKLAYIPLETSYPSSVASDKRWISFIKSLGALAFTPPTNLNFGTFNVSNTQWNLRQFLEGVGIDDCVSLYPGFSRFGKFYRAVINVQYLEYEHVFTGFTCAQFWSVFGDTTPSGQSNYGEGGYRAEYSAILGKYAPAIFSAHKIWDSSIPALEDDTGAGPSALVSWLDKDTVGGVDAYDLDWTNGAELYYIGSGANTEMIRAWGPKMEMTVNGNSVAINVTTSNVDIVESDAKAGARFMQRPKLQTPGLNLLAQGGGTRCRIARPYDVAGMDLANTKMWSYLRKAHKACPTYFPKPESITYANANGKKITLGDLRKNVVARLIEKPWLRSFNVVSSKLGYAAIKNEPWAAVMTSVSSYKIGVKKATVGLYSSGGGLIKEITRGDIPYLAGHGVPVFFPDAANADLALQFTEAMFRTEIERTGATPFSEIFADWKLSSTLKQESDVQMCLASWVTEDGGMPQPGLRLASDPDEGVRYVHALHAQDRTPMVVRVLAALGSYNTKVDVPAETITAPEMPALPEDSLDFLTGSV